MNQPRPSARERGYTTAWEKARAAYLRKHPLCCACEAKGRVVPASVVDHIVPHKGDMVKFWDAANNWQSLCAACHNSKTAREDGAFGNAPKIPGCDAAGLPVDPGHPWNQEARP